MNQPSHNKKRNGKEIIREEIKVIIETQIVALIL